MFFKHMQEVGKILPKSWRLPVQARFGLEDGKSYSAIYIAERAKIKRQHVYNATSRSVAWIKEEANNAAKRQDRNHPCFRLFAYAAKYLTAEKRFDLHKLIDICQKEFNHVPLDDMIWFGLSLFVPKNKFELYQNNYKEIRKPQRTFNELMDLVVWHEKKTISEKYAFSLVEQREATIVNEQLLYEKHGKKAYNYIRGHSGTFYSEKMNKIIAFESFTERDFLLKLENNDEVVRYISQPFFIPYRYNEKMHYYFPDVFIYFKNKHAVVAEVKPPKEMSSHQNQLKWKAMHAYCKKNGFGYIITDGNITLQEVKKMPYRKFIAEEYKKAIAKGKTDKEWIKQHIIKKYQVTHDELSIMALNEGIKLNKKKELIV